RAGSSSSIARSGAFPTFPTPPDQVLTRMNDVRICFELLARHKHVHPVSSWTCLGWPTSAPRPRGRFGYLALFCGTRRTDVRRVQDTTTRSIECSVALSQPL